MMINMELSLNREVCRLLKGIFKLEDIDKQVSLESLRENLRIDDKSKMDVIIKFLEDMQLIRLNRGGLVHLTNKGRKLTLEIIRNGEIYSDVVMPFLDLPADKRIDLNIKAPDCWKGEPCSLMHINPPAIVEIIKILPGNPFIEKQLLSIGVMPGVRAEVVAKSRFGGTLVLKIMGFEVALSRNITHRILVKQL